jgi:hypothetical protein
MLSFFPSFLSDPIGFDTRNRKRTDIVARLEMCAGRHVQPFEPFIGNVPEVLCDTRGLGQVPSLRRFYQFGAPR